MATYVPPKRATEYIFYTSLVSQADTKLTQTNPTLAAADFNVSLDGGALNALTTTPTVTPAGGKMVKIKLSAAEMTADNVTVVCADNAGAEWCDQTINIQTSATQIDNLVRSTTPANTLDVDASGDVTVGALAADAITAAGIAADAIGASELAANAIGADEFTQAAADKVWTSASRSLTQIAGIEKNAALPNFTFLMRLAADHITPAAGIAITSTRRIDAGAFAPCANAAAEVGGGVYSIDLDATDLNGDVVTFSFASATADTTWLTVKTTG